MSIYDHIEKIIQSSREEAVFMEIGCAQMEDTALILELLYARSKYRYTYFAFEPDARNVYTCMRHPKIAQVVFVPAAVGHENKPILFNQSSGKNPTYGYNHTLSGSLKAPRQHLTAHPWCKFDTQQMVRMMRLDDFAALWSVGTVDFIWCDVQGAEDLVLAGAQEVLRRTRYFYTEYYNNEMYEGQIPLTEIRNRLPGPQWEVVQVWPNDALFKNPAYP